MNFEQIKNFLSQNGIKVNDQKIESVLRSLKMDASDVTEDLLSLMLNDFRSSDLVATPKGKQNNQAISKQANQMTQQSKEQTTSAIEFRQVQTLDRSQVSVELAKATQQAEDIMIRIDSVDEQEYEQLETYFDELSQYIEQLNDWQMQLAQSSLNRLMSGRVEALTTLAQGMEAVNESTQRQLEVLRSGSRNRFQRMEQFATRIGR